MSPHVLRLPSRLKSQESDSRQCCSGQTTSGTSLAPSKGKRSIEKSQTQTHPAAKPRLSQLQLLPLLLVPFSSVNCC